MLKVSKTKEAVSKNVLEYRSRYNLILFIISYTISNLVSGILYDIYVNYLQEVSSGIATSFWAYYGYSTFIAAAILILVPKSGYKKLLLLCAISCSTAFFCIIIFKMNWIFYAATIFALTGVQLHYVILAPYIATYTQCFGKDDINWYTRAYYMGYLGYFFTTFLGGTMTVKFFSLRAGISYKSAKALTKYISNMKPDIYSSYLEGCEDVLLLTAVIAAIAIIPVALIKEDKKDYAYKSEKRKRDLKFDFKNQLAVVFHKDAIYYIVYWAIISFAMGLFTSYYTVFLNRNLHIDRATSSLLVSLSYIAMVVFMFMTPYCVKKLGTVVTICFTVIASIPFMLIIANGDYFGKFMIPAVGIALFMRAGFANLGSPADSALAMNVVPHELRPAYNSIVNVLSGLISITSGMFTGKILFINQDGYKYAYYIAGILYFIAAIILYFGLKKKYNRYDNQ